MSRQRTVIFHGVTESAGATFALRKCRDVAKVLSIVLLALDDGANLGSKKVFRIGRPTPHSSLNPRQIKVIFGSSQAADSFMLHSRRTFPDLRVRFRREHPPRERIRCRIRRAEVQGINENETSAVHRTERSPLYGIPFKENNRFPQCYRF